jgi:Flp pilus assembly protein TadD
MQDGAAIMKGEEKDEKDADGNVVGTKLVIDYDAAIQTFEAGIALAVAADSWDLQAQLEERLTNAKHQNAADMKERAQAMAAADPPQLRAAADLLVEALTFNATDLELATLRGGFLKELGKAQQADGGEDDPSNLSAAIATFAEAAGADPADEEILPLRIAALKELGQAAREESEEHPADIPAALAAFVQAMQLDTESTDEELSTLKEECEAALAEVAAPDDVAGDGTSE